jgi:hypothetical protein
MEEGRPGVGKNPYGRSPVDLLRGLVEDLLGVLVGDLVGVLLRDSVEMLARVLLGGSHAG